LKSLFSFGLILLPILVFSQVKELELNEVSIKKNSENIVPKNDYEISRTEILKNSPEDLGDLTKNIPGLALRSYGGLGGMKTFSARGFSSSHVGIIVDGFLIQNTQTNQIDLSNVFTDNLEKLSYSTQNSEKIIDVVSAYFNASNLKLYTFNNQYSKDSTQIRSNLKFGSFGQIDSYLSMKFNRKNSNLSFYIKYREAEGNYPFELKNHHETYELLRTNNDLKELYTGLTFNYFLKSNSKLNIQILNNLINKSLPGAVILYNPTSNQRLENKFSKINVDYSFLKNKTNGRIYFSGQYEEFIYIDSGFLNAQSFQKSNYYNSNVTNGISLKRQLFKAIEFNYGAENVFSFLKANQNFSSEVYRNHFKAFTSLNLEKNKFIYQVTAGIQQLYNQEIVSRNVISKTYFNPSLQINSLEKIGFLGHLNFNARRTLRLPSFNELYFNNIGNKNLKPEIANQISLGNAHKIKINHLSIEFIVDAYFNLVENKIVAIPTKNLFVWSIQNVGKTRILGSDLQVNIEKKINTNWLLNTHFSYSFQDIIDITNPLSETYKHQLAYSPKHILNSSIHVNYKKSGISLFAYYNSQRYILNQNIAANSIPSFYTFDATIFTHQKIKKGNLRYSFSIKNGLNNSYYFIKNYFMPGRNYLISISYEIN
jgi:vitamin B12 transporter